MIDRTRQMCSLVSQFLSTRTSADRLRRHPKDRLMDDNTVERAAQWLYEDVFPWVAGWNRASPENKEAWRERIRHIAALAATPVKAERERCARIADAEANDIEGLPVLAGDPWQSGRAAMARTIAVTIRSGEG